MSSLVKAPETEMALLGGGCFWCLEAVFNELDGVLGVVSGYAGGHQPNPSYRQVCEGGSGHAEVVQVVFDPARLTYRELLEVFFASHDPTTLNRQGNDVGTQYRSIILARDDTQLHEALTLIEEMGEARVFPTAIVTKVERGHEFWPAEAEHQSYFAHHRDLPYCQYVIAPKIARFRERFGHRRKPDGSNPNL